MVKQSVNMTVQELEEFHARYASSRPRCTRLVIFNHDPETGARQVHDIIRWNTGWHTLSEVVKLLPRVPIAGYSYFDARAQRKRQLERLGTSEMPFVIEHFTGD